MRTAGLRTLFTVPICARDEVLAVLGFGMLEVRREDEALMQTVAAIARQLGAALLRKRSEQALQESEERFRATVNAAPSGIAHISLAGRYLLVNDTLCRMLGYERDELLSKSVADVIHPDERAGTAHRMQRLCAGELSVVRTEKRNVHKNGSVIWCAVTATIKRSDSGEPEYLISVLNDISERKEIEKQLVESESRYRQLIHNLPIGIMVHVDDKVAFANPAAARLLAADSAECLVGMATLDIMHPDERDAGAVSAAAALSDGGQGYTAERKIARFDGTSGISELTALPLVFDGKQGLLVATTDITERRAAEQRLLEARVSSDKLLAQLDTLLASAPTGFAFIDRSYRYVRVNDALAAVNGISAQAHIGRYVRDVVPDRWSQIEPIYRSLLEAGGSSATIEVQGSARAPGHWLINYYPVKVGQEVIGVGVIVVDIGERRKMEEQLRHLQKMEAIGALTGGVAHDFNNLLTIVIGNLELIQERVAAEPVLARQIDAAIVAARHGADLTSRLLAFSRQHPLQPVVLDVNEQISKAVPLLRRKLGETIRIQVRLDPNLWPAHVDLGQFENAILNLANNARDAMPIGGSLDLETSNIAIDPEAASQMTEVASGEYVKLSVRDTGTGMPKEIVDRVFEPFFTTKEVGKGTGLGLSMVYGFAKQSGGHVSISSVPGEGTEIALYLPRARRDTALPEVRGTELGEAVRVVLDHVNVNVTTDVTN
jgi:PAS domain S-box-containing protein